MADPITFGTVGATLINAAGAAAASATVGAVAKKALTPSRKDLARQTAPSAAPTPTTPPEEQKAPTLDKPEVQEAVTQERRRNVRQRGRAATVFRSARGGVIGDDSTQATARTTLGV